MKKQDKRRTSFPKSREPRESSQFSLCALMVWRWPSDLGLFHQHQCWALRPPCTAPPCRECPDVLASMGRVVFKVLVAQSCPILCDPMGCSPPGSSVYGIVQAGILEWAAMPSSRGSSWPRDQTWVSCITGRHFTVWATRKVQASNLEAWHAAIHGAQRVGHDLVTEQQIYIYYIHIYALTYILELSFWFIKKFHIHLI